VRAGLIEILELFGIDSINPPVRFRRGEYIGGDSIDRIYARSTVQSQFSIPSAKIETSQVFVDFCIMTQANEPNDSPQQQGVEARLARLEERLSRIERTTVPNDYIRRSFDRVYQDMTELHYKIDSLAIEVDAVKQSNQRIEQKIEDVSNEMNGKLDVIIRRLTGMT
jgi:septal ring factor EnvC (AmiA/AmiB activator)